VSTMYVVMFGGSGTDGSSANILLTDCLTLQCWCESRGTDLSHV